MSEKTGFNKSTIKVLEVFKAMKGRSLTGCTNGALAEAAGETPSSTTRALNTLIEAGLVEKWEDGRFRYSSFMLQIATAHMFEVDNNLQRETERYNRITAGARGLLNG